MESFLTAREVALLFKFSLQTIRRYTMNGKIPFHKINRSVRYKQSEIEAWFAERQAARAKTKTNNHEGGLFNDTEIGGGV
jgi:excisionase family DNA binding protein